MKIKVLLFAHLKEIVGSNELIIELEQGSKGEDVLKELESRYPEVSDHMKYLKLSMNGEYIQMDNELVENAEVAVFPPVSGG